MMTGDKRAGGSGNPILAGIYGAFIAAIFVYAISYLLLHFGLGVVEIPGKSLPHGPSALLHAGLNMYAMQHVMLVGSDKGTVASILLPLTAWITGPALALMIGGCVAAKSKAGVSRWGAVAAAMLVAVLYAGIMWALTPVFHAQVDSSAIPSIDQASFSPPAYQFKADATSAFVSTLIFGVIFTYLGALLALRRRDDEKSPGRWWVCGKSVILTAIVLQLVLGAAFEGWMLLDPPKNVSEPSGSRIPQMLPTTVGGVYLFANGATISTSLEARMQDIVSRPWDMKVKLYRGMATYDGQKQTLKPLPKYFRILMAVIGLSMFFAGWRAVKAGSVDGAVPTALRITITNAIYLVFLMWACQISWGSVDKLGSTKALIGTLYSVDMLYVAGGVFLLSLIGALCAGRRYSDRPGFPSV